MQKILKLTWYLRFTIIGKYHKKLTLTGTSTSHYQTNKMKNLYLISILFIFLSSCEKEEKKDSFNSDIPEWIIPQIEELENAGHCSLCSLTRITFNNEFYYHVYCGIWSCMYCYLYDSSGELVDWSADNFNTFLSEKKDEVVLWTCPNRE